MPRTVGMLAVALALAIGMGPAYSKEKKKQPAASASQTASSTAKVDLNLATQADLDKLPGVGPATAKKIIAGRPYNSVGDLARAGVPAKTIQEITPLVTVSRPSSAPAPSTARSSIPSNPNPPAENSTSTPRQTPNAPGMVWVNTETKVYHRNGDPWYGKTKHGKFMDESEAMKAGYRASKEDVPKK